MVVSHGVGAGDQNPALCRSSWYSALTTEPSLRSVTLGLTEPEMAPHPQHWAHRGNPPEFRVPTDSGFSPAVRKATLFTFHPDNIMRRALSFPGQNLPNKVGGLLERWARWAGCGGQGPVGRAGRGGDWVWEGCGSGAHQCLLGGGNLAFSRTPRKAEGTQG